MRIFAFILRKSIIQVVIMNRNTEQRRAKQTSPYLLVILSFVGVIIFGAFLLAMPFSHKSGQWSDFNGIIDALFHATSATCVTGLSTYVNGIGAELTFFGQLVMLIMIQIGGLGFITILTFFASLIQKRLQFKDRYMLAQAVNSNSIADVGKFVKRVVIIVVTAESFGFFLGLPVFFSIKGINPGQAIWASLFTSISAFNNAGFDIFGATSIIRGVGNAYIDNMPLWAYYYMQCYIMILIVVGGISFLTIIETVFQRKKARQWSAFTRISLLMTSILLVTGFALFCLTDVINGNINPFQALFQSVTCRTAGFANFDQSTLSPAGKTVSSVLMFIGGSPIGTAGGIKTTTIFVIVLCLIRFLQGKKISAFKREFSKTSIIKSMTLLFLAVVVIVIGYILVITFEKVGTKNADTVAQDTTENLLFETFSAFGTVGLSTGVTPYLTTGSKLVICVLMFFGRLGPITLFQIFQTNMNNEKTTHYQEVQTDVIIG